MGTIYRFITRTVLYNLFILLKKICCFVFRFRRTYTGTGLCMALAIASLVFVCINFPPTELDTQQLLFFLVMISVSLILFCFGNFMWLIMDGKAEDAKEPRILGWVGDGICKFFKDITRPLDQQEEIDLEERQKRKKEKVRKREVAQEKKRLVREAKISEQNKFDRFEMMEMD